MPYQLNSMALIYLIRSVVDMKRVVIYARVSTEHEAQISALENQVQY